MANPLQDLIHSPEAQDLKQFLAQLRSQDKRYLLRNDLLSVFSQYRQNYPGDHGELVQLMGVVQEVVLEDASSIWLIRPQIAQSQAYRLLDNLDLEAITTAELLAIQDHFVNRHHPQDGAPLALDFQPFYDYSPKLRDPKNIGKGVEFMNRYLSSQLFQGGWLDALFNFLRLHQFDGAQLMISDRIPHQSALGEQVKAALKLLAPMPPDRPYSEFRFDLQNLGFEPGWGNTVGRIQETLALLDQLIDAPDHQVLEAFISRTPRVFRVALISPHGWFGQEGVLGRPDTGGQVVYILDQVRSLEQQMVDDNTQAGLDVLNLHPKVIVLTRLIPNSDGTLCNQRLEKIYGTQDAWILRVPFREFNPKLTQNWISRFEIWPYLETFAVDAERELRAEFGGKPDLIVGNYSDGNLVAFLLARSMQVLQCNIAHALEKSKYLFSDLYWQDNDEKYHFSLQYTADLIAMNAANFIMSSTYQEIVGTPESLGQYESYKTFTMPELYHVRSGIELFSPKFNVVPPGVNEQVFFPYTRQSDRLQSERDRLEQLLFTLDDPAQAYGQLTDPNKRPLFSMARLDRIKNLTGLAAAFGQSPELQERCNLILIAGKLRTEESTDHEEISEIQKLYQVIQDYNLEGKIRWLGVRLTKPDTGEVYRIIADRQGVFVQPALFEAFGLTVLESMITGLPTFATQFGGPLEIIQDGVNGFYINPTDQADLAQKVVDFLQACDQTPDRWKQVAESGIERVYSTYTWDIHTRKLLNLAKLYGFWNHASQGDRADLRCYLDALFHLLYRPRAQALMQEHLQR
jgi:sucrose synthase